MIRSALTAVVVVMLLLAGCNLLDTGPAVKTPRVTPAPVPTDIPFTGVDLIIPNSSDAAAFHCISFTLAPGEKQATLTIESTDPDEPTVAVTLTGMAASVFPAPLVIEQRGITLFEIGPPRI